ncbi:hypothetical protein Ciccas_012527 [Cichlidogyrus casuarinus]|uniref:Uncharacterized protein n=1 Tax=Cichlidogyrus casuarinus TaxID=1844966 RepID=A0ABD2PNV4_9PLAT
MATKEQWVKWVREGQTENTIPEKPFEVQTGWYQLKDAKLIPINVEVPKILPSTKTKEEWTEFSLYWEMVDNPPLSLLCLRFVGSSPQTLGCDPRT